MSQKSSAPTAREPTAAKPPAERVVRDIRRRTRKHHPAEDKLEAQVARFVEHYNHHRAQESLDNLTPADVYFGRGNAILQERQRIKRETIQHRRLLHLSQAA